MKNYFLNIFKGLKETALNEKTNFNNKTRAEKWVYALRVYSLYMVVAVFTFSLMSGIVAGYALLFYGSASFVAFSFFISRDFSSQEHNNDAGALALKNIIFYTSIVFLPAAFIFSGMTNIALSFFIFMFSGTVLYYYLSARKTKLKDLISKMYATAKTAYYAAKTEESREQGGLPYAVYEVGDNAEGIQE